MLKKQTNKNNLKLSQISYKWFLPCDIQVNDILHTLSVFSFTIHSQEKMVQRVIWIFSGKKIGVYHKFHWE